MSAARIPVFRWVFQPVESLLVQVPRALCVSALAAVLDIGLLITLVETVGWHPLLAATVSYLAGGVLQYILCSLWVFGHSPENAPLGFVFFTVLSLVGLIITWCTLAVLYDFANVNYAAAKILALGLAFLWNFTSRKYFLFQADGLLSGPRLS